MKYYEGLGWITTMKDVRAKENRHAYFMIVGIISLIILLLSI